MPLYDYRCTQGHVHEYFFSLASLPEIAVPEICRTCESPATRIPTLVAVFGDIPEHYNVQFGEPVRGRKHFKRLQEEHGTSDYDARKVREHQSADWKHRRDKVGPSPFIEREMPDDNGPPLVLDPLELAPPPGA